MERSVSNTTEGTRKRYDRLSSYYDLLEVFLEKLAFSRWRERLFGHLKGDQILEVGVGTGKNLTLYPHDKKFTAIDFSAGMLKKARRKAERERISADLIEMDVEKLRFDDQSFDTVIATFVFCSVPDPIQGLREVKRVCRKGGRVILMEHVRPSSQFLGRVFDVLNLFTVRLMGVHVNRETVANIKEAGLRIEEERNLFNSIVKMVVASP